MKPKTSRKATCFHEAGHAVMSYLLGVRFLHAAVFDDRNGEVVPESSVCRACFEYYERRDPSTDSHSRRIQDNLRCAAAIAVAGEIAEEALGPGTGASEAELARDRKLARSRASAIHMWATTDCYSSGGVAGINYECAICDGFLQALRSFVRATLRQPKVAAAVTTLAGRLDSDARLEWEQVAEFLRGCDLTCGSLAVQELPPPPSEKAPEQTDAVDQAQP